MAFRMIWCTQNGRRRQPARSLLAAVALLALLASCSSPHRTAAPPPSTPTAPTAPTTSTTPPAPALCGSYPGAAAFWLDGPQGIRLEANTVGRGPTAVVFLHQSDHIGMCGFWSYATWLASHRPIRAVLFNRCAYGRSICPSYPSGSAWIADQAGPAAAWARAHGATRVVMFGASIGGGDAVEAASAVPGIAAVVAVSEAGNDSYLDPDTDARNDHVPTLFAVAPSDPVAPVATIERLYAEVPARPKKLLVLTAAVGMHGWALLGGDSPLGLAAAAWMLQPTG